MISKLGLGGGCHWCTEAIFQSVPGVQKVEQGYIKSSFPLNTWSEAVIVHLEDQVDLELLLEIHLETHHSSSNHSRREQYRSAVYYFNEEEKVLLDDMMHTLSRKRNQKHITQVIECVDFIMSRETIQNYYRTRPDAPFCKRYIKPKLQIAQNLLSSTRT